MNVCSGIWVLSAMLAGSGVANAEDLLATLKVRASGFRSAAGQAVVALYNSPDGWLKVPRAFRAAQVEIKSGSVEVRFDALPAGAYAVVVIHDENKNGKMDMRWFPWPKPKEGSGLSNAAKGGPPKWKDARFDLRSDAGVDIQVAYP